MARTPFQIRSEEDAERARLRLIGELDIDTVRRVQDAVEELRARAVGEIVLDLSELTFVDSSGLRLFIVLDQRADSEGWRLGLIRPPRRAMTVFEVSGVEESLPFIEDPSVA
jgi:anti-anti-sigma factor